MSSDSPAAGQNPEELLQIVDENDEPAGEMTRAQVHAEKRLHRAVHILVFNRAGELYLQKRSQAKDRWPGYWDSSSAGHVSPGEPYDAAAVRELEEELGIAGELLVLGKIAACEATDQEFVTVYTLIHDGDVHPDANEIEQGEFVPLDQLRQELSGDGRPFTPCFRVVFQMYEGIMTDSRVQ